MPFTDLPVARVPGLPIEVDPYNLLIAVAGLALLLGAVVLSVQKGRPFSAALIYLVIGLVVGVVVDVAGVRWFDPTFEPELLTHIAEFAVIVSIFGAGVKLDRPLTWAAWRSTALLLIVAMPLTILGVALLGTWALGLTLPGAILLGASLAPTDPVLADDVQVEGPGDEQPEDEGRFSLTAEAGLNDSLAFPFVMLGLFGAQQTFDAASAWIGEWLLADVLYAIGIAAAGGAGAGLLIAMVTYSIGRRGWLSEPFDGYVALASVFMVYGLVEAVEGYGFLAVFVAGVAFRRYERDHSYNERLHEFTLTVEKLAEMAVMLLLGTVLPLDALAELALPLLAIVGGLLFVVRPAAAWLSLVGSHATWRERVFIGWFGIRGVGSVYYLGFTLISIQTPEAEALFAAVSFAVVASVVLHGLTSSYLMRRLLRTAQ
jgi:NhaP-type Na+/H+ or K+/H+ antiporter